MASVHFPKLRSQKSLSQFGESLPYILDGEGNYIEGVNHYLHDRIKGRIDPKNVSSPRMSFKRLSEKSSLAIAAALADATSFLESQHAHPTLGPLSWTEARQWMFSDIYSDAMEKGYWTHAFWQSGQPVPLNYSATMKTRIDEAVRCGMWQQQSGYLENFDDASGEEHVPFYVMEATRNYEAIRPALELSSAPRRVLRKNPSHDIPPAMDEIVSFIEALPSDTARLGDLLIFETGMRGDELEHNLRAPSSWTGDDLCTDGQVGFLPHADVVWSNDPRDLPKFRWRILGKGNKIRFVIASPRSLRSLWNYFFTTRNQILERSNAVAQRATNEILINRYGGPFSYHNLYSAMRETNIRLGRRFRITQHILRHAHACAYLEAGIAAEMAEQGIDVEKATYEQFMSIGQGVLLMLKVNLGHALWETTSRYLVLLAHGKIAVRYQIAFNLRLDALVDTMMTGEI